MKVAFLYIHCRPLRYFGVNGDVDGKVVGREVSEGVPCHVRGNGALCDACRCR